MPLSPKFIQLRSRTTGFRVTYNSKTGALNAPKHYKVKSTLMCVLLVSPSPNFTPFRYTPSHFELTGITGYFQTLSSVPKRYWIWKYDLGIYCWHDFALSCLSQMKVFTRLKIQRKKCTKYDVRWLRTLGKKIFWQRNTATLLRGGGGNLMKIRKVKKIFHIKRQPCMYNSPQC